MLIGTWCQGKRGVGQSGFTLLELMIVVAIIGILVGVAMPNYQDHVVKGKITEATSNLSQMRMKAEQYFADHSTYVDFPCSVPGEHTYFSYSCPTLTAATYSIQADGRASAGMGGYTYKIDQSNTKRSQTPATSVEQTCWAMRRSGTC